MEEGGATEGGFEIAIAERLRPRLTEEEKANLKAEKEKEKEKEKELEALPKTPTPDLKALIIAGICKPAKDCLCVRHKGKVATADLLLDGAILYRGECYPTLSPFSRDAHNTLRKEAGEAPRLAYNGWGTVFYLIRPPDEWVVITVLREQLYAIEAAAEAEAAQTAAAEAAERELEAGKREEQELAAANRGPTAGGQEMADALLPPINSAFSDKGVKSAFARRHEQALVDAIIDSSSPGLFDVITRFRRGKPGQMRGICEEVEKLLLAAAFPAAEEALADGATLDDLAEEVLDRCKETFGPFCVALKERGNNTFAGAEPPAAAAAAAPAKAAAVAPARGGGGGGGGSVAAAGPRQKSASVGTGRRAAAPKNLAEPEYSEDEPEEPDDPNDSDASGDDDSDSGARRKKRRKGAAAGAAAAGGKGGGKKKGGGGGKVAPPPAKKKRR